MRAQVLGPGQVEVVEPDRLLVVGDGTRGDERLDALAREVPLQVIPPLGLEYVRRGTFRDDLDILVKTALLPLRK